jgi:hypothetical protein
MIGNVDLIGSDSGVKKTTNMRKKLIRPSSTEDAAMTEAALSDPDSLPLTDQEWEQIKPHLFRGSGWPLDGTKVSNSKN